MENFKDIKGYENIYQVSDKGNVKSLARVIGRSNGTKQKIQERILSSSVSPAGFNRVALYGNEGRELVLIHKLVAVAFLDHKPNGRSLVIKHINGNKADDNLNNLEVVPHRLSLSRNHGASKLEGVSYCHTTCKFVATIYRAGKQRFLGRYMTENEAAKAVQLAVMDIINQSVK